jgi:hypothetical protein
VVARRVRSEQRAINKTSETTLPQGRASAELTKHTPNFSFAVVPPKYTPPLLRSAPFLPNKMADSDLFDGAIGIDLGTTYSYVSALVSTLHLSRLVQLRGGVAK